MSVATQPKFVHRRFLAEVLKGSREEFIEKVKNALWRHREQFEETADGKIAHLATNGNFAVVINSRGQFFRAKFQEDLDGTILITTVEKMDVPVLDQAKMSESIMADVQKLIQEGKSEEAQRLLSGSLGILGHPAVTDPQDIARLFVEQSRNDRAWSRYFKSNEGPILEFIGHEAGYRKVLTAKWQRLYNGGLDAKDTYPYRALVEQDLRSVLVRVEGVLRPVSERLEAFRQSRNSHRSIEADEQESAFRSFAEDLMTNMDETVSVIRAVLEGRDPIAMAVVHDTVVPKIIEIETAGMFVVKLAESHLRGGN